MNWMYAPNQIHMTDEERRADREQNIHPPDDSPWRLLAAAVILDVAKEFRPGKDNTPVEHFFLGEDYAIWSTILGLNIDGETMLRKIEEQGGVSKTNRLLFEVEIV